MKEIFTVEFFIYHPMFGVTQPGPRDILEHDLSVYLSYEEAKAFFDNVETKVKANKKIVNSKIILTSSNIGSNIFKGKILNFFIKEAIQGIISKPNQE